MHFGTLAWQGRNLTVSQLALDQKKRKNHREITIPRTVFSDLKLNSLIFHHRLSGSTAEFFNPQLILRQQDPLRDKDSLPFGKQTLSALPFKIDFATVQINKGHLDLTLVHKKDSLDLKTGIDLAMDHFRAGYDPNKVISAPADWKVVLRQTFFRNQGISGRMDSAAMNNTGQSMNISGLDLSGGVAAGLRFRIQAPQTRLTALDYHRFFRSDSLVFGNIALHDATLFFSLPPKAQEKLPLKQELKESSILYDSLQLIHAGFIIERKMKTTDLKISGKRLDLLYRPMLRTMPEDSLLEKDFLKKWDISLQQLRLSDTLNNIRVTADGIALQSRYNRLFIDSISGSNLPPQEALEAEGKDYARFRLLHMKFTGLHLAGKDFHALEIARWTTPEVWMDVVHGGPAEKKPAGTGLIFSMLGKNSGLINRIHIDSTRFNKLNFKFFYDNRKKLINIFDVGLAIHNIELDSTLSSEHPNYVFNDLRLDTHGKAFLSGDSMYTFRIRGYPGEPPAAQDQFRLHYRDPQVSKSPFLRKSQNSNRPRDGLRTKCRLQQLRFFHPGEPEGFSCGGRQSEQL